MLVKIQTEIGQYLVDENLYGIVDTNYENTPHVQHGFREALDTEGIKFGLSGVSDMVTV